MRRLVVTQFVSLDGVMEGPGGENPDLGPWTFKFDRGEDGNKFKVDEVMAADALLLGRVTYEGFAAAWPDRKDEAGFADKFNAMEKHVVSSTLSDPSWNNTHVIDPSDIAGAVAAIKQAGDGDILVNGSNTLMQALMESDLVDEYRLMVFPVILGQGKKLFQDGRPRTTLKLESTQPVGPDGVVVLTYVPVRD
jgi:dihydrofolate reductase